ncbi:type I DNA topoisomerase [Candidatus Mycoplasma pogonae]
MSKLVIVESPNKEKTIKKYLGEDYEVMASVGHIVKMKTSGKMGLGIDFENWEPEYVIDPTKREIVKKLKKAAEKVEEVLIATDPDREGEAIGENLVKFLKVEDKYQRIKYNEITKEAILRALEHPLKIDENLVKSQKTRRMIDRIIGFRLSNLINRKIANAPTNPSAGRVQSVALKLIIDREKEINDFIPIHYHTIKAVINKNIIATYFKKTDDKNWDDSWVKPEEITTIMEQLKGDLVVNEVKTSKRTEKRFTPFKQSALYKKAGLAASTVQSALQKLYEGFGEGGLISYPRTDSTRLSTTFIDQGKAYINKKFGSEYVSKIIKGVAGDQDAHEAIRPTDVNLTPEAAKNLNQLNDIELRVYTLIYNNTLQSLMEPPVRNVTSFKLSNNDHQFKMSASKIIFDGYYALNKDEQEAETELPNYQQGDKILVEEYVDEKHETKPPARYNDGSLIETLDEIKVGRPSTFASTVKILKERLYSEQEGKALKPTSFGDIVNEMLVTNFPNIINETYTSKVEENLDLIAEGKQNYKETMQHFWDVFEKEVDASAEKIQKQEISIEKTGELCPESNHDLIYRTNKRTGQRFIACSGFPNCRFVKSDPDAKPTFKRRFYKSTAKSETESK